jgi:hypothetical protein
VQARPTIENDLEKLCAGVTGLVGWLIRILQVHINIISDGYTGVGSVLDIVDEIVESIPVFGPAISLLVDFVELLANQNLNNIKNVLADPAFREQIYCKLYCMVKAQPSGGNRFTEAVFNAWCDYLQGITGAPQFAGIVLENLARDVIGFAEISFRFSVYAKATSVECEFCTECPDEWCYTFDFLLTNGGWEGYPGATPQGSWISGTGWRSGFASGPGIRQLSVRRTFAQTEVTSIVATFDIVRGTCTDACPGRLGVNGSTVLASESPVSAGTNRTISWSGSMMVSEIYVTLVPGNLPNPGDPGGQATLKSVVVRGKGVNPFGGSNCQE